MFAGGGEAVLRFRDIFSDMITEAKMRKVFAGKVTHIACDLMLFDVI